MLPEVFIVCLRQPGSTRDYREDPYWEVGSFGCTGCHQTNLLNPAAKHIPNRARLAFAQGGRLGVKLVLLTPAVQVAPQGDTLEVKWKPRMPFRYADAPLLVNKRGDTDFPSFKLYVAKSKSASWLQKLSSKCRSRAQALPPAVAAELIERFDATRAKAARRLLADTYLDAIPEWASWEARSKADHPW
jgi:hypothetical protein